jgi:hypothetical protein
VRNVGIPAGVTACRGTGDATGAGAIGGTLGICGAPTSLLAVSCALFASGHLSTLSDNPLAFLCRTTTLPRSLSSLNARYRPWGFEFPAGREVKLEGASSAPVGAAPSCVPESDAKASVVRRGLKGLSKPATCPGVWPQPLCNLHCPTQNSKI